ncbi:GntR family transcriptional regulator [Luteolibacter pohnpeiensis]|uniref:GntR family transcriptional regulator n=1 Tax=Luteolibacter pohnpeiensis TaxID=454153 RepID=A0A934SAV1_9BACT|nr:GntR family transcriptional regulator [Luteolibacter pohnpeiensis]MBK1882807.1 GntR family transcriptional regulator [Luteolibacter pohnpeiensis]
MSELPEHPVRYREVARQLRDEVISGRYGKNGKMPSEAQLVSRFGVSRPTVAKALSLLGSEGLVERRAGSGTYAKSEPAVAESSKLLALLIPNLENTEIFQLICGEIASLARLHNFSLVWGGSGQPKLDAQLNYQQTEELCRQFIERRVSGVFFAPHELIEEKEKANRAMAVMLREAGIPVVLLDRDFTPFPTRSDFDLVGMDNAAAGFLLADHLLRLGCTRIHFVARPHSAPSVDARISGVREALGRKGINPDRNWLHVGEMSDRKFIRGLIGPLRPDAYICANDHTAALLMREFHKANVRVPQDVRVVGFDDVKFATLVSPPLTTVQQPCREMALTAFRAMMARQSDPMLPACHLTLPPRLVIRDSCGAYLPRTSAVS